LKERDVAEQFKKRVEALSQEKTPDMALCLLRNQPSSEHTRRTPLLTRPSRGPMPTEDTSPQGPNKTCPEIDAPVLPG
jgi:hypothetical protein